MKCKKIRAWRRDLPAAFWSYNPNILLFTRSTIKLRYLLISILVFVLEFYDFDTVLVRSNRRKTNLCEITTIGLFCKEYLASPPPPSFPHCWKSWLFWSVFGTACFHRLRLVVWRRTAFTGTARYSDTLVRTMFGYIAYSFYYSENLRFKLQK